jgi:nucleoside phosphorylase
MSNFNILLVTPTTVEQAAVRPALERWIEEGKVRLEMCGVGTEQASAYCWRLEKHHQGFDWMVLIGYAGGLTRDLKVGDLVMADSVLAAEQPSLDCQTLSIPGITCGPILTAPQLLATPQAKQVAASGGAVAVEMEAYPLARWARQQGLAFLHARVILDGIDERVPDVTHLLDPSGNIRIAALIKRLSRQPALTLDLIRFARRVNVLRPQLEAYAKTLIETMFSLRNISS